MQRQKQPQALTIIDRIVASTNAEPNILLNAAQAYAQMGHADKLEGVLQKIIKYAPDNPEAWYDLATVRTILGKTNAALEALGQSIQLSNKRLKQQTGAVDLLTRASADPTFQGFRRNPTFEKLLKR